MALIEEYVVVGDRQAVAPAGRDGSIDFMPRRDEVPVIADHAPVVTG